MVLATFCFGCLDTLSKYLVAYYPASALVWLRYVLQTVVMMAIFLPRMGARLVRTSSPKVQVLRSLMLVFSSVVFVVALNHMQIAEVASIVFLAPIIVALAGGPLLGERVGMRTWFALAGGFTGVLLIIRPGGNAFTWWALLPLGCAFFFAGYQILTRKLAGRDDPITTLFYPGLVAVLRHPAGLPGLDLGPPRGTAPRRHARRHRHPRRGRPLPADPCPRPGAGNAPLALRLHPAPGGSRPRLAGLRPASRRHRPHRHRPHRRFRIGADRYCKIEPLLLTMAKSTY